MMLLMKGKTSPPPPPSPCQGGTGRSDWGLLLPIASEVAAMGRP